MRICASPTNCAPKRMKSPAAPMRAAASPSAACTTFFVVTMKTDVTAVRAASIQNAISGRIIGEFLSHLVQEMTEVRDEIVRRRPSLLLQLRELLQAPAFHRTDPRREVVRIDAREPAE